MAKRSNKTAQRIANFVRLYNETGNASYLLQAKLMERIERLVRRPRRRGPHLKAFTADERALFMKIEARVAAGETEHAAARLELDLVYEDALGNYPGRVKAVVQRLRDWRAWEAECRAAAGGKLAALLLFADCVI